MKLIDAEQYEISRLKATLKQADEAYDIQGKQLLEAQDRIKKLEDDLEMQKNMTAVWKNKAWQEAEGRLENEKLKEENVELGFESVRAFERGQKFPCNLNCEDCTEKCRAWQNGFNHNRPTTEIIGTKALIESYIDRLQNCGFGKKKSLEYVGKFISCLIFEKAESNDNGNENGKIQPAVETMMEGEK